MGLVSEVLVVEVIGLVVVYRWQGYMIVGKVDWLYIDNSFLPVVTYFPLYNNVVDFVELARVVDHLDMYLLRVVLVGVVKDPEDIVMEGDGLQAPHG